MTDSQGFWSYVHADDHADGGRIGRLLTDIIAQYEMLTNETIELFFDREDIQWGEEWKSRIEGSLATVAFFIPILTPRYFASAICRNEFNSFARRATDLGIEELLLPILYMDFPGLEDDDPADELVALVKKFQWVDWRELRFSDPNSPEYRRAVFSLASRLADANRDAERIASTDEAIERAEAIEGDIGTMELLAAFEAALPLLTSTVQSLTEVIITIGSIVEAVGAEVSDPANQSFARRLLLMRKLAAELEVPTEQIGEFGENFTSQLHDVDLGVRLIIERSTEEPESANEFKTFFDAIRGMVESAETGLGALQTMIDAAAPLEALSRGLRPPLRNLRHGLTLLIEGREVMRPWLALMEQPRA